MTCSFFNSDFCCFGCIGSGSESEGIESSSLEIEGGFLAFGMILGFCGKILGTGFGKISGGFGLGRFNSGFFC